MPETLRHCPFCGGVHVEIVNQGSRPDDPHVVQCDDCDASASGMSADEAMAAWNRRAERTCHDEAGSPMSFLCGECWWFWNDPEDELGFRYCPNCGARIRAVAE